MSRLIVIVALLVIGYFLLKRSLAPRRPDAKNVTSNPEGASSDVSDRGNIPGADRGEDMVFDEMCKSYISKETAITIEQGGKVHYFCGGACRQMFINSNQAGPY